MADDLESAVTAALVLEAPRALVEPPGVCPQANIDRDLDLLGAVLSGEQAAGLVRIWANRPCVVLSKRLAARSGFAAMSARLARTGVAVAVRASGGAAVLHRPGVINVSLVHVDAGPGGMGLAYTELTDLLGRALARLGVEAHPGRAHGAYCDGDYNLLWRGRKVAGTAAIVRRRDGRTGRLVHASLVVTGEVRDDLRLIALAERALHCGAGYALAAHATVAEATAARNTGRSPPSNTYSRAGSGPALSSSQSSSSSTRR